MAYTHGSIDCCGISELSGISGDKPEKIIKDVVIDWFNNGGGAFIFFSCEQSEKAGRKLCSYIRKNKLGEVVRTKAKRNSNSSNMLCMWTWAVNKVNLKKWAQKNYSQNFRNPNRETPGW